MPSRGGEKSAQAREASVPCLRRRGESGLLPRRHAPSLPSLGLCPGLLGLFKTPRTLRVSSLLTPSEQRARRSGSIWNWKNMALKKFFLAQFCLVTSRISVVSPYPTPTPRHACFKVTRCLTESRMAPAQCLVGPDSLYNPHRLSGVTDSCWN